MPKQRKRAKKLNNNNASALLKKNGNNKNNNIEKDERYNPLDALADKFIDLSELRQKHRGSPPKGVLELELEALVFEDLYKSESGVRQNVRQKDNVSKQVESSAKEGEEFETLTENAENNLHAFDTVSPVPYSIDISPETYENNNDNMNTEKNDHLCDDCNSKESEMKNRKTNSEPILEIDGGWQDSDDENITVSLKSKNRLKKLRATEEEDIISGDQYEKRLRNQFEKLHPTPNWAIVPSKRKRRTESEIFDGDSSDIEKMDVLNKDIDESLVKSGVNSRWKLKANKLEIYRMQDANRAAYSQCAIQSLKFHPNSQVIMTAGLDKTIRLFQVDGKKNPKIQSVIFNDLPILRAEFNPSGSEIIISGRRKHFYIYNIEAGSIDRSQGIFGTEDKTRENFLISPCGKYIVFIGNNGYLTLVSYQTKQQVANLKMNGSVDAATWSSDGKYLFSAGKDATIYQWDVGARKVVHCFADEGGYKPKKIAVSRNNDYFAIGSHSGIVNIYDDSCLSSTNPKPMKSIMNLTTSVHDVKFNHDTQILGISSHSKRDQLKMVHLPSFNVFSNWPNIANPLGYVQCFDFSPNSGYITIGNEKGKALLYRLLSYPNA